MLGYRSGVKVYGKEEFYKERLLEIRNEELYNSKRSKRKSKQSLSSRGRASVLSALNDDVFLENSEEIERPESSISGLSLSRPATALPPREDHLEKVLFDGIVWRQQSIANKDILTL